MATVINPKEEETHTLSNDEAWAFFEAAVKERLGITAKEFLQNREGFKDNPHFDSLIFLLPLVENESK